MEFGFNYGASIWTNTKSSPTKKDKSIINGKIWKHIIIQSLFQLILLFLYLYAPLFIKEKDFVRLVENKIISLCYQFWKTNKELELAIIRL